MTLPFIPTGTIHDYDFTWSEPFEWTGANGQITRTDDTQPSMFPNQWDRVRTTHPGNGAADSTLTHDNESQ